MIKNVFIAIRGDGIGFEKKHCDAKMLYTVKNA